jgi:hypothetical protein
VLLVLLGAALQAQAATWCCISVRRDWDEDFTHLVEEPDGKQCIVQQGQDITEVPSNWPQATLEFYTHDQRRSQCLEALSSDGRVSYMAAPGVQQALTCNIDKKGCSLDVDPCVGVTCDARECYVSDGCEDGDCIYTPEAGGTACTGGGSCDGAGACIPAGSPTTCGNNVLELGEDCEGGHLCQDCKCPAAMVPALNGKLHNEGCKCPSKTDRRWLAGEWVCVTKCSSDKQLRRLRGEWVCGPICTSDQVWRGPNSALVCGPKCTSEQEPRKPRGVWVCAPKCTSDQELRWQQGEYVCISKCTSDKVLTKQNGMWVCISPGS